MPDYFLRGAAATVPQVRVIKAAANTQFAAHFHPHSVLCLAFSAVPERLELVFLLQS